ncbi:hypothetical protein LJR044_000560 [Microbacterium foliorum]
MAIAFDFEQIFAELKRIERDMQQFPAASEVAVSEGGSSKATAEFRIAVTQVAQGMGAVTENSIAALNDANQAIRQAVTEIAEQDAALADEAKLILTLLDSAGQQTPAGQQPVGGQTDAAAEEPEEMDY